MQRPPRAHTPTERPLRSPVSVCSPRSGGSPDTTRSPPFSVSSFVAPSTRAGTRVRDTVYWNYFDSDVLAWRLRLGLDDEFRQTLAQIRRALEPLAAALAAQRRRPEDIALLRQCLRQIGRRNHSRQSFCAADRDFHVAICSASGNPIIRSIASVIETALTRLAGHSQCDRHADLTSVGEE